MKQKEIKVLMAAPGEHPREVVRKNDLDALQKAVSIGCDYQGLIEDVELDERKDEAFAALDNAREHGLEFIRICEDGVARFSAPLVRLAEEIPGCGVDIAKQDYLTMAYVRPFKNGVFVPYGNGYTYGVRRYINGCPTNEWIQVDMEDETITTSDYRFEDADFENLPDLSAYITSLDLSQIAPQHTDPSGKILIFNSAVGWYETTETGVYAIVRIAWRHYAEDDYYMEYYDETFILLDETGDHIISREELIELIGDNQNVSYEEYGVGIEMPMC